MGTAGAETPTEATDLHARICRMVDSEPLAEGNSNVGRAGEAIQESDVSTMFPTHVNVVAFVPAPIGSLCLTAHVPSPLQVVAPIATTSAPDPTSLGATVTSSLSLTTPLTMGGTKVDVVGGVASFGVGVPLPRLFSTARG
ncbi:hypothetical protein SUGI_0176710 [Cryptomeria japonica]|nr:hypothetical protein SUGI_0176710 [Cryptomeria japonica]